MQLGFTRFIKLLLQNLFIQTSWSFTTLQGMGFLTNLLSGASEDKKDLIFTRLLLLRIGIYSSIVKKPNCYVLHINKTGFSRLGATPKIKGIKYEKKKAKLRIPVKRGLIKKVCRILGLPFNASHSEAFVTYEELEELCKKSKEFESIFGNLLNFYFEKIH